MTNPRSVPLWLASLLIAGAMLARLAAAAGTPPAADPPTGQLLVAAERIADPRFSHSVILLVRHDNSGAFGIMINRPLGERPIAELLAGSGHAPNGNDHHGAAAAVAGTIRVFFGGPVQPQVGFVIHSRDYKSPATLAVAPGIGVTSTRDILRDIGRRRGPKQYRFAIGYAGWGAGQLEGEIAHHDWFTAPAAPDLVFDGDAAEIWRKALARRTEEL